MSTTSRSKTPPQRPVRAPLQCSFLAASLAFGLVAGSGCSGQAKSLFSQGYLGPAVRSDAAGSSTSGVDIGNIYSVTQVVPASIDHPYTNDNELPFTGPAVRIGQPVADGQTYFHFDYTYPPNNYKLAEAHLVVDTSRDNSDTEGVFVDGVFSGRPPLSLVSNAPTAKTQYRIYYGNTAGYAANSHYIDWAIAHYKRLTRNTFDLNVASLITPAPVTVVDLVKDGRLPVVMGDDSPVDQAYLVLKGYTISKEALQCHNSSDYTFQNVFLHNDGNSIGQAAFSGTTLNPFTSQSTTGATFQSTEFYYDAQLPRVTQSNVTLTTGSLALTVKRNTSGVAYAAIVINGIGIAEPGFDTSNATSAVEQWETGSAVTAWSAWVASIPATNTATAATLSLLTLLGADRLRSLVGQGKLNISFAGSISQIYGQALTTARGFTAPVAGPEFSLGGTYFTEICAVPDNASSPLSDTGDIPSEVGDAASPVVSSLQVVEVTATTAVVQWLTNEPATSQAAYGVGNTNTLTTEDSTPTVFHSVKLTGLLPYKVYIYRAITKDRSGNTTQTDLANFRTLR